MLRQLITWVLNTYLGKYLEDFNSAQITVALFSGEVELEKVPLRKDAFRRLGLPLQILSGSIGKIKLQIPVRQFRTAPWCISIEDVNIVVAPINLNEWNHEKEKLDDLNFKLSCLNDIEAKWRAQQEENAESGYYAFSYSSWLNYGTSFATNIVENLQLKVNDVHIRYEDDFTSKINKLVYGITIESLIAQSCDSSWNQIFNATWNQNISFKLVELKSFAFYFDFFKDQSNPKLLSANSIDLDDNVEHQYIINPISAQAHFKHDRSDVPLRTRSRPRLSCDIVVSEIRLSLNDIQYSRFVECIRYLELLSKLLRNKLLRPQVSVKENPKAWWIYAIKCHGLNIQTKKEKLIKAKNNLRYIKIYSKILNNSNEILNNDDKQFKNLIELESDLDDLKILRKICLTLVPTCKQLKEHELNKGKDMLFQWFPQWWGWYGNQTPTNSLTASIASDDSSKTTEFFSISSENTTNDQYYIEDEILNMLAGSVGNDSLLKRDAVFGKFDFILKNGLLTISGANAITGESTTMMDLYFSNLKLNIETRPRSGSHLVGLSLGSVCFKDLITKNTEFQDLIKPQTKEHNFIINLNRLPHDQKNSNNVDNYDINEEPWFQLQYEHKPLAYDTDYRLAIKTKSIDIVYNIDAFMWVFDFFIKPLQVLSTKQKIEAMKNKTKIKLMKNWKSIVDGDLVPRKSWSFEIDISAPQIIFVENFTSKDTAIVIVDFGKFQLLKNATQNWTHPVNLNTECLNKSLNQTSDDDEAFMTPYSSPLETSAYIPSTPVLPSSTVLENVVKDTAAGFENGFESAFHENIYDKYTIALTDLQVLVCIGKEKLLFANSKGSSQFHLLDRFNISLQLERRIFNITDIEYPSFKIFGTLPKLVVHVNEQKVIAVNNIWNCMFPNDDLQFESQNKDQGNTINNYEDDIKDENSNEHEISNLVMLQFVIDQMSIEVESRSRSIAELQVTGVKAGLSKCQKDINLSLSVHGLLLVDAIQSFGPDFELLVASHRHVGMDSISGSLKQSEPNSPITCDSPETLENKRPTSPQTITKALNKLQRANFCTWSTVDDLGALITVEVRHIFSKENSEPLQLATIHFNNLDVIANQETVVELLGFMKRVFPNRETFQSSQIKKSETNTERLNIIENMEKPQVKIELTFDFNRLNILIVRALNRDTFLVGRKVGTFTMSEAKIYAIFGSTISVEGSLGGLQILDLTPEGINHQRIFSVGKDPLTENRVNERNLWNSLTEEVYSTQKDIQANDQEQALSFHIVKDIKATIDMKIRMASVWYTHCARFIQELSWCANEFKHYLKNFAKSLRNKAADMALGFVNQENNEWSSSLSNTSQPEKGDKTITSCGKKIRSSRKINIKLDVILSTPVLVVPRSSCSSQVLVAHLGQITINNRKKKIYRRQSFQYQNDKEVKELNIGNNSIENHCESFYDTKIIEYKKQDVYFVEVRNMNVFSLDTSNRKGFRMSALPRAEDFYSCDQDAIPILDNTGVGLEITKFSEDNNIISDSSYHIEHEILEINSNVTQPIQFSLSRIQYEQLLETLDNILKVPVDLVQPPSTVPITCNYDEIDDSVDYTNNESNNEIKENFSYENQKNLKPKITFTLPAFIIQLKDENNSPLIEICFREFNLNYERNNIYETKIQISLRSILMKDLLCSLDSKHRQMVTSLPINSSFKDKFSSFSCPNLVQIFNDKTLRTSLPENLELSAGYLKELPSSRNFVMKKKSWKTTYPQCPDTPPPSPQLKLREENLVIYSSLFIDPHHPDFETKYNSLEQHSSVDFNSLDLIISVEKWYLLLNFFGLLEKSNEPTYKKDEVMQENNKEQFDGNSKLEIEATSLTVVLVRNECELAKVNVSNACFIVSKGNKSKVVEGSLGSVSLYDLTSFGKIYTEKFLTSGDEALYFLYERDCEKSHQRSLNKDAYLKIKMSSVKYVHTKRFINEIQAFIKEFLQLQTPVIRKIRASDSWHNVQQRPTQLGLEISAGSPMILLPLSFESNQVIVANLGEITLKNSFHLASEDCVISRKSDDKSSLDEILNTMQINLVNTDLFTGYRCSNMEYLTSKESCKDILLDMGSYWLRKRGSGMLKEKCHLKLQVEMNMDSWKSHNCPDISIQGTLSSLEAVLDIEQYKLVRGFFSYNLGESVDDIYVNEFSATYNRNYLNSNENEKFQAMLIWTAMSINLDLENVSIYLLYDQRNKESECSMKSLARIDFIKSSLKIDLFSDGAQDIDLVSQEILITDRRFYHEETPRNVFTNILQPINKSNGNNLVQAEIHSRQKNDQAKYTILLNNMRVMAIIDWLEDIRDYLNQNYDPPGSMKRLSTIGKSPSNSVNNKTSLEFILNITDSELVFVEKTDQSDSNAVILKSTTIVSLKPLDEIKPMRININHLEVFSCILGYEEETALSIIDPVVINLDITKHVLQLQLQKQLCIRLSYRDVKMFLRMFQSLPKQTRTAQNDKNRSNASLMNEMLVKKLINLGFHEADCKEALKISKNCLENSALWLTLNAEPARPNTNNQLEIHSLEIRANYLSICIIDDCKDADVPLLEFSLSQLEFYQKIKQSSILPKTPDFLGHLITIVGSDYYNRHLSGWEPVIEPWKCKTEWHHSISDIHSEKSRINVNVESSELLKFNITTSLIELWQIVQENWTQDYYEGYTNDINQINCIQSPTGYRRRNPFIPFCLKNQTDAKLWFKILVTTPGGITRTEISSKPINNIWIAVEPGQIVPFSFDEQKKQRHIDSHKHNLHQIIVQIDGWSEIEPISVDRVGKFFRYARREVTAKFQLLPKSRILFSITLEGSAQKMITVSSALKLVNNLENFIMLKMIYNNKYSDTIEWPNPTIVTIEPKKVYSIPLLYVFASFYIRPLIKSTNYFNNEKAQQNKNNEISHDTIFNGNECWQQYDNNKTILSEENKYFDFCKNSITWWPSNKNNDNTHPELYSCRAKNNKIFYFVVSICREAYSLKDSVTLPGHIITLMPPIRLHNLLCCDLLYKLSSGVYGRIQPSNSISLFDINIQEIINITLKLDGYKASGQILIPPSHSGSAEPKFRLTDSKNRDLFLRASIQSIKGNGLEIAISAPYWLINRTGLPLIFRQEGVSHEASGQFKENEQARLLSPLMFSFSDPDTPPALTVRLGNRYGSNPQWSQSISFNKGINHCLLKSGNSNETFVLGIEVRHGRGRYARTSVVTFSPRFQIYNRSSFRLQFAQKCYATTLLNPEASLTIIEAVPGCHLPFNWPRIDKEQLLCIRLPDVNECLWSGSIPINTVQSIYINIRNVYGDMFFLRLEIILQGATNFLVFGDAYALQPPIRIDNYSEVPIKFSQPGCRYQWRTIVKPHFSKAYALDEPTGPQILQIEAPGGVSNDYSLRELGLSTNLTHDNFIYIAFKKTFENSSISEKIYIRNEYDVESQHLVFGVKGNRVILVRKRPGDRNQLWRMNSDQQLEHEGSSPPIEPGKKPSNFNPRLVLDIEKEPKPLNFSNLIIRPANPQRKATQTWRFTEEGRLMCNHANMCVQARDGIFGLRPDSEVVLGTISPQRHSNLSFGGIAVEQLIERQKFRPGSGCLSVNICMDGPIKTVEIKDVTSNNSTLIATDHIKSDIKTEKPNSVLIDEYYVNVHLLKGIGISIISNKPSEELAYITLEGIFFKCAVTSAARSIDICVRDMQIDNQLFETTCPVLLYTSKNINSNEQHNFNENLPALKFSIKILPSPNENAVLCKHLILALKPFVLNFEERLILKFAAFFGYGVSENDVSALTDQSDFEAQQVVTKLLAANAKRYYFERLELPPCQIRLSVITVSKLSPKLNEIKKRLGLTLIKFEDVHITFEGLTYRHNFETMEVYWRSIKSHYKNELKSQAASILGSVDFLGNPLGFANDLSEGVSELILKGSVTSLVKNVTHGISNSTAKLTETISDGLGRVALDDYDNEKRQRILEVQSGIHSSVDHLAAGIKGFSFGLFGGATSIFRHTYEGAQNDGFQGFLSGLGKGIVGTVTKPIIGVLDLASETANAIRETSKSAHRSLPERKRLPRCLTGAPGGLLPRYSSIQSKGQQYLYLMNKRNFTEQLMSYEPNLYDGRDSRLRLLVSSENIRIFSHNDNETSIILSYHLSEVLSCHPVTINTTSEGHKLKKALYYIELSLSINIKSLKTSKLVQEIVKRPRVRCQSEEMAQKASRHINYAKSVYDERQHTMNFDALID